MGSGQQCSCYRDGKRLLLRLPVEIRWRCGPSRVGSRTPHSSAHDANDNKMTRPGQQLAAWHTTIIPLWRWLHLLKEADIGSTVFVSMPHFTDIYVADEFVHFAQPPSDRGGRDLHDQGDRGGETHGQSPIFEPLPPERPSAPRPAGEHC